MTETSHPETRVGMKARGYSIIFLVLVAVTLASLLTGEILFARNTPDSTIRTGIILGVSTLKALLIVMFYMHLKFESRPVQIVAAVPVLFLAILMIMLSAFPNPSVGGTPGTSPGGHGDGPEVAPAGGGAEAAHPPAGAAEPSGESRVAAGEALFKGKGIATPCSACHSAGAERVLGPGLKGVGAKGEAYIREAIVNPGAQIAEGTPPYMDVMPKTFAKELCGKETLNPAAVAGCQKLDDLVAYLVSLK
ncbi:MAG: cytochrome C oxidase subunit IV family protein [Halobacteria archaeon]